MCIRDRISDARVHADLVIRFTSHQLCQQPIGLMPAGIDRPAGHVYVPGDLCVGHPQEPVHHKDFQVLLGQPQKTAENPLYLTRTNFCLFRCLYRLSGWSHTGGEFF